MKYLSIFLFALLLPVMASAHLAAGEDRVVEGILVDFGYDPAVLVAGELSTFSMNLVDEEHIVPLDLQDLWVRVDGPEGVVSASRLALVEGNANWQLLLPTSGDYRVTVRANEGEYAIDETFAVAVEEAPQEEVVEVPEKDHSSSQIMMLMIGLVMLIVVLIYFARKED